RSEQTISANRELEELGVLTPAAGARRAAGVDQHERLDVADHRLHLQAAAVHVRRQRAADGEPIRAGLLLRDPPLLRGAGLTAYQPVDERRPHDARLDLDDAPLR